MSRNRGLVYAVAMVVLVNLAGCSQTSTEDPGTSSTAGTPPDSAQETPGTTHSSSDGNRLIDAGDEPRSELRIGEDVETAVLVEVTKETTTTLDGEPRVATVAATYALAMDLGVSGSRVRLSISPDVTSIDPAESEVGDLGTWLWRLDTNGELSSYDDRDLVDRVGGEVASLLSTPDLVLVTPDVPVGLGAQWAYLNGEDGQPYGVITLDEITEFEIGVTIAATVEFDGGSLSIAGTGTYDRRSLLVRNLEVESVFSYSSQVSANGQLVDLSGSQRIVRAYRQVTP